jgi:hypothetical protein
MMLKHHYRCPCLNPPRKLQNENFWHRHQIWLDCEQQLENSILRLTGLESDWEPNTIVIEDSLPFPMVIYMAWYDKQFRSFEIGRTTGIPVLSRLEQSENFTLLSPVEAQSQKTSNTKHVPNFHHFLVITHMLKSDKQRRYDHWNTVHKWMNLGYSFRFGLMMISQNSADSIWYRSRRKV